MITYVVCDLFESPARVLVNTVNTVGVMGKGIAKDFKQIYPDMFQRYRRICEDSSLAIGDLWLYKTNNKWVLNFPTKRHWRNPSHPEYIRKGLAKFVQTYHNLGITSISFPMLGCGNGELDWELQVRPLMEEYLEGLPITVFIHLQDRPDAFIPEHRDVRATLEWLHGEPGSLPFVEVWDAIRELVSSRTVFSKLNSGESFYVEIDRKAEAEWLTVSWDEEQRCIPFEAFREFWLQIRQLGFVSGDRLPYGFEVVADYLVSIMAELPYLQPVEMADDYSCGRLEKIGLRLVPRPRQAELPLFSGLETAESR